MPTPPVQVVDAPLGRGWLGEYMAFCLGHSLATAGALELAYRIGRAHADFEKARRPKGVADVPPVRGRSVVMG